MKSHDSLGKGEALDKLTSPAHYPCICVRNGWPHAAPGIFVLARFMDGVVDGYANGVLGDISI